MSIYFYSIFNICIYILSGGIDIETRKLILFGKSSFVVSLPKSWIRKNGLKKGDDVFLSKNDNNIILSIEKSKPKSKKDISISTIKKDISRIQNELVSAYINNYKNIKLVGQNLAGHARQIKEILYILPGLEVIEETKSMILLKEILDEREISVNKLIRRIDNITRGMLEDAYLSIDDNQYGSILQRDLEVNRTFYLLNRIVRSHIDSPDLHGVDPIEIWIILEIAQNIEKAADQAKRIARTLKDAHPSDKSKKAFKENLKGAKSLYVDAMKSYYLDDRELAFRLDIEDGLLIRQCFKSFKDSTSMDAESNNTLSYYLNRINDVNLMELFNYLKSLIVCSRNIARSVLRKDITS